jgi:hypothetical protein
MFLYRISVNCVSKVLRGYAAEVRTVIEPVPKAIEAILYQVFRRSEVEPRIDCDT